jgi:transforming growth factor-beta-induced protein
MSDDLRDGMTITTVQGQPLTVAVTDTGVTLTDASGNTVPVVQADIEAGNGVVHVIDKVLLPAAG